MSKPSLSPVSNPGPVEGNDAHQDGHVDSRLHLPRTGRVVPRPRRPGRSRCHARRPRPRRRRCHPNRGLPPSPRKPPRSSPAAFRGASCPTISSSSTGNAPKSWPMRKLKLPKSQHGVDESEDLNAPASLCSNRACPKPAAASPSSLIGEDGDIEPATPVARKPASHR